MLNTSAFLSQRIEVSFNLVLLSPKAILTVMFISGQQAIYHDSRIINSCIIAETRNGKHKHKVSSKPFERLKNDLGSQKMNKNFLI